MFLGNNLAAALFKSDNLHKILEAWEKANPSTNKDEISIQTVADKLHTSHPHNLDYLKYIQAIYEEHTRAMDIQRANPSKDLKFVDRHQLVLKL